MPRCKIYRHILYLTLKEKILINVNWLFISLASAAFFHLYVSAKHNSILYSICVILTFHLRVTFTHNYRNCFRISNSNLMYRDDVSFKSNAILVRHRYNGIFHRRVTFLLLLSLPLSQSGLYQCLSRDYTSQRITQNYSDKRQKSLISIAPAWVACQWLDRSATYWLHKFSTVRIANYNRDTSPCEATCSGPDRN